MEAPAKDGKHVGECQEAVVMNILGISCYYHDAAAALLQDGVLTAAAEEERFTRLKHDSRFPVMAIRFCLDHAGIVSGDIDYVVFYEKPFLKFDRILRSCLQTFPRSYALFREAMGKWLLDKLWVRSRIKEELQVDDSRILFSEHHLSHAASAFFCSPFNEAAILTLDGVGEWATATMGYGRGTEITLQSELRFPHSLGLLYSVFTAWLGFEVNEGEYKVMGMAAYGTSRYVDKVKKIIQLYDDGSFRLNMDYLSYHYSPTEAFNGNFIALFGPPRDPRKNFFTASMHYPAYFGEKPAAYGALADENQYYADVAASIQAVTEEAVLGMSRKIYSETGLNKLCLAGGVALNSVANGRILREAPFKELYIQPAAGDGGGAIGAALFAYHMILGKPRRFVMEHAYWGKSHDRGAIEDCLQRSGLDYIGFDDDEKLMDRVVDLLQAGRVVGWFQGRFEWGPRALGNRSILADPRRPEMKDIVNAKIKFREPYRPFAPAVLVERSEEFFELEEPWRHYPSRFMLYVVKVQDEKRGAIPAVTHVDGTGRVQTVSKELAPRFYRLIEKFSEGTGIPVLLNTSFNLKGQPIVNTPQEALDTFVRSGMDALVLDRCLVTKTRGSLRND